MNRVKSQNVFKSLIYVHFFCLDTSQANQRKSQNPNGTISFYTIHSHNRRDGVYLLFDSPGANDIMELRSIRQV